MALPKPSEESCFNPSVFESEDFSVDEFVGECKKRVSTEHLHDDLKDYYAILKAAMVELINKDYGDFLDLSANLVGMDKQIEGLALPMSQLHQEILTIKHVMEKVAIGLEDKLSAREEIRNRKVQLKKVIDSVDSIELLERLLESHHHNGSTTAGAAAQSEKLDRIAMEFNQLRHNMSAVGDIPLMQELTPRVEIVTSRLQTILEGMLSHSLKSRDHTLLLHTLETYSLICNVEAAEGMFREMFVSPALKEIISTKAVLTSPQGLDGMYSNILKFVPKQCGFVLEVSKNVPSFDILVNAVWAEIVSAIETRAPIIFAPGNPDTFYKNFCCTMSFLNQFEGNCLSVEHVKKLRCHASYGTFLSKWSLPVYFQIRFQEIGGKLENQLELPLKEEAGRGVGGDVGGGGVVGGDECLLSLKLFSVLYSCMCQCWTEGTFLLPLAHRFWKLTLQLLLRTKAWLLEVLADDAEVPSVIHCTQLVHDIHVVARKASDLFKTSIKDQLSSIVGENKTKIQKGILEETCASLLLELTPRITELVTTTLGCQAKKCLEPINTIPRLYRRTNREIPSKPSGYVQNVLKPVTQINSEVLGPELARQWKESIINIVTEKYQEMTADVLDNVKRTEDSLLKLKRNRRSVQVEVSDGMTDDNKIRLQVAIDIEAYAKEVKAMLPPAGVSSPFFQKLLDMASMAKTTAYTST